MNKIAGKIIIKPKGNAISKFFTMDKILEKPIWPRISVEMKEIPLATVLKLKTFIRKKYNDKYFLLTLIKETKCLGNEGIVNSLNTFHLEAFRMLMLSEVAENSINKEFGWVLDEDQSEYIV